MVVLGDSILTELTTGSGAGVTGGGISIAAGAAGDGAARGGAGGGGGGGSAVAAEGTAAGGAAAGWAAAFVETMTPLNNNIDADTRANRFTVISSCSMQQSCGGYRNVGKIGNASVHRVGRFLSLRFEWVAGRITL